MFFCSKDCPDLCAFNFNAENGKYRFDEIMRDYLNTAFVCGKLKNFYKQEVLEKSSSYVLKNGIRTEIDFSTACVEAADFIKKYSGKKTLYLRGSGSLAYYMAYWDVLISKAGDFITVSGGPCDDTGTDAHVKDFGVCLNPPVENLEKAETVILFGKDCKTSSSHVFAYLKQLRKKGKTIIYIDPRKTETALAADKYIRINPGADGLLAAAVLIEMGYESGVDIERLLDESGVAYSDLKYLCSVFEKGRVGILTGYGLQRYTNGMSAVRWINRLAMLTGNGDRLYFGHGSKKNFVMPESDFKRSVPVQDITKKLEEGFFDAAIIVGANPAVTYPETDLWRKGLEKIPLMVVDVKERATSKYADVFLRVGGMFSQPDTMGSYFFENRYVRDEKISDVESDLDAVKKIAEILNVNINIKVLNDIETKDVPKRKYIGEVPELLIPAKGEGLRLLSSSSAYWLNSQLAELYPDTDDKIYISEKTAMQYGLSTNNKVKVIGRTGFFIGTCEVGGLAPDETVCVYKNRSFDEGTPNMAHSCIPTDSGTGLAYYDSFVELEKL